MAKREFSITAQLVDIVNRTIKPMTVVVRNGRIAEHLAAKHENCEGYLIPGFIDSHIHIESSMLLPSQFARTAVLHGTVATVSDPHEIANVCGIEGINLMLDDADCTPFKFYFGAPACVPATTFETSGSQIGVSAVDRLLDDPRIGYLSEMMNFPGVLNRDPQVMAKIAAAHQRNKPVDGHAPGLRGEDAIRYVNAGISTDHECTTLAESIDKIRAGCKIAIREGSAARNFDALETLIDRFPDRVMLCSDDKHPDELLLGHINELAARAIRAGRDIMNVLRACSLNTVQHYGLDVGMLQIGDPADLLVVDNLQDFSVRETYIDGECVARNGACHLPPVETPSINRFSAHPIGKDAIQVPAMAGRIRIIKAIDGQLVTGSLIESPALNEGRAVSDPSRDLLKLVVVNRYRPANPAVAFVKGFGLSSAAIASSVAHDSHNIIATGADDDQLVQAINAVIDQEGGLSIATGDLTEILPLPIAGLMSDQSCETVGQQYRRLDRIAKDNGCTLQAPFMTLSFLALLVIPALKLSDRGLFDVDNFELVDLFVDPENDNVTK